MRVLGVDPGLTRCGLGVVDGGPGRAVRCVAVDVVRTPVDAELATRLLQVADDSVPGPVLHAANEGAVSRFGQARAVFSECGADPERLRPVSTDQFPRPAPRPSYSALGGRESAAAGLAPLRPWRAALVAALAVSEGGAAPDRPLPSTR